MLILPSVGENEANDDQDENSDDRDKHEGSPSGLVSQAGPVEDHGRLAVGRLRRSGGRGCGRVERFSNEVVQDLDLEVPDDRVGDNLARSRGGLS